MLKAQPQTVAAARIGRMFRIDPAVQLMETDPVLYQARVAAYQIVADDERAATARRST